MANKNTKLPGRPVGTTYRAIISDDWVRTFSLKDRLLILLGAPLNVGIRIACQHRPGQHQPFVIGMVSKERDAASIVQERCRNLLEREAKPLTEEEPK